jgi:hypothetical protein
LAQFNRCKPTAKVQSSCRSQTRNFVERERDSSKLDRVKRERGELTEPPNCVVRIHRTQQVLNSFSERMVHAVIEPEACNGG